MPALVPTEYTATITWLGVVRRDTPDDRINAVAAKKLILDFGGPIGDRHHGLTRPSCVRVKNMHAEGTEIANARQISIVSQEEIDAIADEMGLDTFDPSWLGATMVVSGIPDFTHIPPSSRLQAPSGVALTIDMENHPCIWPGKEVERDHPGFGPKFKTAARGRRGVTAWVERPGSLGIGEKMALFIPGQRPWNGTS